MVCMLAGGHKAQWGTLSMQNRRHVRKCFDCGHVEHCIDNVMPHVICSVCASQDTRPVNRHPFTDAVCGVVELFGDGQHMVPDWDWNDFQRAISDAITVEEYRRSLRHDGDKPAKASGGVS